MPLFINRPLSKYLFTTPPDDAKRLLDALSDDPSDRTAGIALGQWLNANPEYIKTIYRPDAIPYWFLLGRGGFRNVGPVGPDGRYKPYEFTSGPYFIRNSDHPVIRLPGSVGLTVLFDRAALVFEGSDDTADMETLAMAWAQSGLPLPLVMTRAPTPRLSWFTPEPVRDAKR